MTLSLEKEIIVLENSLEKAFNFGSRNLYQPYVYAGNPSSRAKCLFHVFTARHGLKGNVGKVGSPRVAWVGSDPSSWDNFSPYVNGAK